MTQTKTVQSDDASETIPAFALDEGYNGIQLSADEPGSWQLEVDEQRHLNVRFIPDRDKARIKELLDSLRGRVSGGLSGGPSGLTSVLAMLGLVEVMKEKMKAEDEEEAKPLCIYVRRGKDLYEHVGHAAKDATYDVVWAEAKMSAEQSVGTPKKMMLKGEAVWLITEKGVAADAPTESEA